MTATVAERFEQLPEKVSEEAYNFEHFRTIHLLRDVRRTLTNRGVMPGEMAPDFERPTADGGSLRLSDLRGRVVLLHLGSYT